MTPSPTYHTVPFIGNLRSAHGEQVALSGPHVDEQPQAGQFGPVPLELLVTEDVRQAPASPGQVRPGQPHSPLRRSRGEVDHDQVPLTAAVTRRCRVRRPGP